MVKMLVFLGNPGIQYRQTRHNAGWLVCDRLVSALDLNPSWQTKFHAQFIKQMSYVLLKPQTFMNKSGISVQEASKFFGIPPAEILIVHDDIELPFGEVRLQTGGGMGGHNGLRSVHQHLGTEAFGRLRVGVGRPTGGMQVSDYVLARFSPLEEKRLENILDSAVESALQYLGE